MSSSNYGIISFEVNDFEGKPHRYETVLIPASEGMTLSFELVSALGEPLMAALGDLDVDPDDPQASIDLVAVGKAFRSLDAQGLSRLSGQLCQNTSRDGLALSNKHEFDKAYRGNYWELYQALWRVIQENRFLPLLDTFGSLPE